jgi:hypothetical protein
MVSLSFQLSTPLLRGLNSIRMAVLHSAQPTSLQFASCWKRRRNVSHREKYARICWGRFRRMRHLDCNYTVISWISRWIWKVNAANYEGWSQDLSMMDTMIYAQLGFYIFMFVSIVHGCNSSAAHLERGTTRYCDVLRAPAAVCNCTDQHIRALNVVVPGYI